MAKITRSLSRCTNSNGTSQIMLRITVSRTQQIRLKSGIYINPSRFKDGRFVYPRANQKEIAALHETESRLQQLESTLIESCVTSEDVTSEILKVVIDKFHNPAKYDALEHGSKSTFFEMYKDFMTLRKISPRRRVNYMTVGRILFRYEAYRRETHDNNYLLSVDSITAEELGNIIWFIKNEHTLYTEPPKYATDYPEFLKLKKTRLAVKQRGVNFLYAISNIIRAFFNWCYNQGLTENRPFQKMTNFPRENYGTPFYLTIDERDKVAEFDLSEHPKLVVQRDIFIFQCLVGCRVSDLMNLRRDNVSGNFLEYIPQKTENERKDIVRVPLKQQAKDIIERYKDEERDLLLPFDYVDKYNTSIREILRLCGIDRMVTVINPKTGKDERKPICDVASSHMARRTFIGNLYKKVKDPNLIGSMSGHKEGSKAFARYREIDDDIKMDVIDLI